jgi:hypothetical protein
MIINEMKNHLNEDSGSDEEEFSNTRTIILAPMRITYESGSDEEN